MNKIITSKLMVAFLLFCIQATGNSSSERAFSFKQTGNGEDHSGVTLMSEESLPFSETFDSVQTLNNWTIVNHNSDEKTWMFFEDYETVVYLLHENNQADDYLISPEFTLDPSNVYMWAYEARIPWGSSVAESFSVLLFDPDSTNIVTLADYPNYKGKEYKQKEQTFSVPSVGKYRIGFYVYSQADRFRLEIDNVELTKVGKASAPGGITNLSVQVASEGQLTDTIRFTAPSVNWGGSTLTELSKIEIYRLAEDTTLAYSFENPTPGTELKWVDEDAVNGNNSYQIKTYNTSGYGPSIEEKVYVGVDIPVAINEVHLSDNEGKATIIWTAPLSGINNAYINPESLTYRIVRNDGVEVANGISGTTYTDESLLDGVVQAAAYYTVYASSTIGEAEGKPSNAFVFGAPYKAPFAESFANSTSTNNPWLSIWIEGDYKARWDMVGTESELNVSPQDDDGGFITFNSYDARIGAKSRMLSPLINISDMANPMLGFWVFHYTVGEYDIHYKDYFQPQISVDGDNFIDLADSIVALTDRIGWTYYERRLIEYKNSDKIGLGFLGVSYYGNNVSIDNITIYDGPENDLALVSFIGPKRVSMDQEESYKVQVENLGGYAANNYSIEFYFGENLIQTIAGTELEPNKQIEYTFNLTRKLKDITTGEEYYKYYAKVVYDDDDVLGNNISDTMHVTVRPPALPVPLQLTAERGTENNVKLMWVAPEERPDPIFETVTEDFEDYTAFSITNIGDWTMYDLELDSTIITPLFGKTYPQQGAPMAYQVFNSDSLGLSNDDVFAAKSGVQYLFSMAAKSRANDNWLVSPMLSTNEQTISFWVKQPTQIYGTEKMVVLYSTTDKHPDSFIKLSEGDYIKVDYTYWKEFTFTLPKGARYFAVQTVSKDILYLCIDDITFEKTDADPVKIALTGYNVYRNDTLITSLQEGKTEYVETLPLGQYSYTVTAVYDKGESSYSNEATLNLTSVKSPSMISNIKIYGHQDNIYVNHAEGKDIEIISIEGKVLNHYKGSANTIINYKPGLYFVRVGQVVEKVIVQ